MRRSQVPPRGGWNLVELTVVIGMTSVVLGVVSVLALGMMRLNRSAQFYDEARRSEQRLETALRRDVHAALAVEADETVPGEITLQMPGSQTVVYRVQTGHIERRLEDDGMEVHREAFLFPRGLAVHWELEEVNVTAANLAEAGDENNARPRQVSVVFERTPSADNTELPRYDWRMTAIVGLDQLRIARWESQP